MKFYLAGPFFNQPQIELIAAIELLMVDQCVPCFSPRQQHQRLTVPVEQRSTVDTTIKTAEQARKVFHCNVDNIDDCTHMLAVVDWLLLDKQEVRQVDVGMGDIMNGDSSVSLISKSGPLNLPDSGTVWEMGYAYSLKIPIILFRTKETKLNVMLTQCAEGVVTGLPSLEKFLNRGDLNFTHAPIWKGSVI